MAFIRILRSPLLLAFALGCNGADAGDEAPPDDPNANADGDCLTDAQEQELGSDPRLADSDADGLDDCAEVERGTSLVLADTDGDGLTDPDEVSCVSDPLDPGQKCYACGWKHNDPGNLVSTGKNEGDVIANMQLVDQCLEPVGFWDFAATPDSPEPEPARYYILLMSAAW